MIDEELSIKELKQIEYEQLCEDWRHRDSMLWQSLAVAITLTGIVFGVVFSTTNVSWISKLVLFSMASTLNWVLLLKITKDHYYQLGSNDLLSELGGKQLTADKYEYEWRIHKPSELYFNEKIQNNKIPSPHIYEFLMKRSAFKWFFGIQLLLLIITLISVFISLYNILLSFMPSLKLQ